MALAIPITNGHMSAGAQAFVGGGSGGRGETAGAPDPTVSTTAADMQGTGALSGMHNTPLHVAGLLVLAGTTIFALHYLGFRVAFDVGLGR